MDRQTPARGWLKPEIIREKRGNSRRAADTPCKQSCHSADRKNRSDEEERRGKEPGGWHGFRHLIQTHELCLWFSFASLSQGKRAVTPAASGGMGRMGRTPTGLLAQG